MFNDILKIVKLNYEWEKLTNKTILLSGGTGFIGSFFCDVIRYRNELYNQNIKIVSLSRNGGVNDDTVNYIKQDITIPFELDVHVDYVIHLASNTHPKQYAEDPIGTIITNVYGSKNLLDVAKSNNAMFILASSVEIYGQGSNTPMNEDYCGYINCNKSRAGYNESKRVCESLLQSYRDKYNIKGLTVRFSRVFGPDRKEDTKAIAQFLNNALKNEDIVLKSEGRQRYSYCYINDAVSALCYLLLNGVDGEAYNVSDDDDGLSLGEYAKYIASLANKKVIFDISSNNPNPITYALLDTSKIKKLGWVPLYTVKDGLKMTYNIKKMNNF